MYFLRGSINISIFYFKPLKADFYIFIYYFYSNERKKVTLEEIIFFKDEIDILNYIRRESLVISDKENLIEKKILKDFEALLNQYFSGDKINLYEMINKMDIELNLENKFKTEFSKNVVESLLKVKPGDTTTYYQIGAEINSRAFRAIGNVCKSNPLPLIIPCHRVLRKNGEIGGFMGKTDKVWETDIKKFLLKIEK